MHICFLTRSAAELNRESTILPEGASPQNWADGDCSCLLGRYPLFRTRVDVGVVPEVLLLSSLSFDAVCNTKCQVPFFRVEMRSSFGQIAASLVWLFAGLIVANETNNRKPVTLMYLTG